MPGVSDSRRGCREVMNMAIQLETGMAAPLIGLPPRFHVLSPCGMPLCMRSDRPPLYPIDYDHRVAVPLVPHARRCHRWGCLQAWTDSLTS